MQEIMSEGLKIKDKLIRFEVGGEKFDAGNIIFVKFLLINIGLSHIDYL